MRKCLHKRWMSHIRFPENASFTPLVVVAEDRDCEHCGGFLYVLETKHRYVWSSAGATHLIVRRLHCPDPSCAGHKVAVGQQAELAVALPYWSVTWDVFAWMGHRRFSRHWSVPQIRAELQDRYRIEVSSDWIEDYLRTYQAMVSAREADVEQWAADYQELDDVILTIDGLQPEKGHETLYVVRELRAKRVWFAEPLLSSSQQEVDRLFARAAQLAKRLGKPVRCWMSDKQEAFVKGIAKAFPKVPHRYCANHFLRDVAKPVLEADSHAKVQMRRKVRGLRKIEKRLLRETSTAAASEDHLSADTQADAGVPTSNDLTAATASTTDAEQRQIVLDYCGAVRGILNDDQGGPLQPPGLRMSQALEQVNASILRNVQGDDGVCDRGLLELSGCIERGRAEVADALERVGRHAAEVKRINDLLDPTAGTCKSREAKFQRLAAKHLESGDVILRHMGATMKSFAKGLFAGGDDPDLPADNLELERSFRLPKSHERRIHGHAHAGVRIVQQGPSLMLVLDGHARHPEPFESHELSTYADTPLPDCQLQSERRRKIMRLARSSKRRPALLESLEQRYLRTIRAT
jgi:hypothetical protein